MGLNLESTISLNSAGFEKGMHRVKDTALDSIKTLAMAAIGVGAVEQAFERTFETASKLVDESQRLDMTVEQVQILKQAAKDAGAEFENVAGAIEKINLARAKALGGSADAAKMLASFAKLGINKEDLKKQSGADLFTGQISATVKAKNIEEITAPMRDILGKGAGAVVATLKTDFDELGNHMRDMGAIMSNDTAAKLDKLGDEFELISKVLITNLAPSILKFTESVIMATATIWKKLAEFGAGVGDMVAQVGVTKTAGAAAVTGGAFLTGFMNNEQNASESKSMIQAAFGIDEESVAEAKKTAGEPFEKFMDEFKSSLANAAADLEKKKVANFNNLEGEEKAAKEKRAPAARAPKEADAMVRVGNFLGTNVGAVNGAAARMEKHANDTATNTKQTALILKQILQERMRLATSAPSIDDVFPMN